jgi:hypothetical protein
MIFLNLSEQCPQTQTTESKPSKWRYSTATINSSVYSFATRIHSLGGGGWRLRFQLRVFVLARLVKFASSLLNRRVLLQTSEFTRVSG